MPHLGGIFISEGVGPCFVQGIKEKEEPNLLSALQVQEGLNKELDEAQTVDGSRLSLEECVSAQ